MCHLLNYLRKWYSEQDGLNEKTQEHQNALTPVHVPSTRKFPFQLIPVTVAELIVLDTTASAFKTASNEDIATRVKRQIECVLCRSGQKEKKVKVAAGERSKSNFKQFS